MNVLSRHPVRQRLPYSTAYTDHHDYNAYDMMKTDIQMIRGIVHTETPRIRACLCEDRTGAYGSITPLTGGLAGSQGAAGGRHENHRIWKGKP